MYADGGDYWCVIDTISRLGLMSKELRDNPLKTKKSSGAGVFSLCSYPDSIPHNVGLLLVVSLKECIARCYMICHISRILVCLRSTPWCGSTLGIFCIVVFYFASGEVAQFGLSYFVGILCGIFHSCWLLVRYLRRTKIQHRILHSTTRKFYIILKLEKSSLK
jgi:hypothetical protein